MPLPFVVPLAISILAIGLFSSSQYFSNKQRRRRIKGIVDERDFRVCVIGAGLSGICTAIKLKERGIKYDVYDVMEEVGGTWFSNNYPKAGCDVPIFVYCYSFAKNFPWSKDFALRDELLNYFISVAKKFGVRQDVNFRHKVLSCNFLEKTKKWIVTVENLENKDIFQKEYDYVISATGQLNHPNIPLVNGRDDFNGEQFHTSQWDHSVDLKGKRVIGIGTGASAVQAFPEVAKQASDLLLIQRSPTYFIPKSDAKNTEFKKTILSKFPVLSNIRFWVQILFMDLFFYFGYHKKPGKFDDPKEEFLFGNRALRSLSINYLKQSLTPSFKKFSKINKDLLDQKHEIEAAFAKYESKRESLIQSQTPSFVFACKRIGISNDWYPMLIRDNVSISQDCLVEINEASVTLQTEDREKREVEADVIIWATGFKTGSFADFIDFKVVKESGDEIDLKRKWNGECKCYKGVSVDEIPNLSIIYGPNTNLGHSSIVFMVECQVNYSIRLIEEMLLRNASSVVVKSKAYEEYNEKIQKDLEKTVFAGGCNSWYKTKTGFNVTNWPKSCIEFFALLKVPDFHNYQFNS